jgi:hypothetical protein
MKLAALTLAIASIGAQAGPIEFTHRQTPDNWSDWDKHVTVLGIAPAFVVELVAPEWSRPAKFGACMVPGIAHEFIPGFPTQGNTWSLRDVVSDAVGCGIGLFSFEGRLRLAPQAGGVKVTYSWSFQ